MRITILGSGTSTGNPSLLCKCRTCLSTDPKDKRLRASVLVETEKTSVLIDCGPDFRYQALRADIQKIDAVLITHEHYDHVGGLDDLRPFCFSKPLPVYASGDVLERFRVLLPYSFRENPYPGVPLFELHNVSDQEFRIQDLAVTPVEVMHYKLPVLGYRMGNFCYLTDFNHISPHELNKVAGTKVLIIDALRHEPHLSHNTLQQALDVIAKIQPEQAWLIHMSHDMGLHEEVEAILPDNVRLCYDGLRLECED